VTVPNKSIQEAEVPQEAYASPLPEAVDHAASRDEREREHRSLANRAVSVSAVGLGLTGAIELAIAILTGSVGLLGDALHNLSDVSTSAVVFFGFWVSKKPPTERYPYGYQRAEDLAGLGVALVIWVSALFAGYESVLKFIHGGGTTHLDFGIAAAILGISGNLLVARYKLSIGRRIHSSSLVADAHHSRLDAMSSAGALAGLLLVAAGFPIGDPIAGLGVTVLILHVGLEVTKDVMHHLLDGIEPEFIESVRTATSKTPGVTAITGVRARWTGRVIRVDVDARLSPDVSLADAISAENSMEAAIKGEHEMVHEVHVAFRQ
jgi:cation diffusion facilitator family transporter